MIATLQRCIDLTRSLTRSIKVADTLREDLDAARRGWACESRIRDEATASYARASDALLAAREELRRARAERDQTCEAWRAENEIAIQERDDARKADADARSCLNTVIENGRATVEALRFAERERDEARTERERLRTSAREFCNERDAARTILAAVRAQLAEVENREAARRAAFFTPFASMPDESRPFLDKAMRRIVELEGERDQAKDDRDRALQAKLRAELESDRYKAQFAEAYWLCKADRARLIPDTLSEVADVYGRPVAEYVRRSAGPDYDCGHVNRATAICVALQALSVAERFPVVGRFQEQDLTVGEAALIAAIQYAGAECSKRDKREQK